MPTSATRPSTINYSQPAEIPLNSMAGQQRLQISELQFVKFLTFSQMTFEIEVSSCSDILRKVCSGSNKLEMVDSVDELKSSRSIEGKDFPNFV